MKKIISIAAVLAFTAGMMTGITSVNAADSSISTAEELLAAFSSGGNFTLDQNVEISDNLTPNNNLTLDLNGNTIDLGANCLKISNAGTYKFENGTIKSSITGTTDGTISLTSDATDLSLSNVTVEAGNIAVYISAGSLAADSCTFNNSIASANTSFGVIHTVGGKIDINDSDINYYSGNSNSISGIRSQSGSSDIGLNKVNISRTETTHYGRAIAITGGNASMSINGGEYDGGYQCIYWNSRGTLEISNGTFDFASPSGSLFAPQSTKIKIEGGTFKTDPSQFVDTNNYIVTENEEGTYTVKAKAPSSVIEAVENANQIIGGIETKAFKLTVNAENDSVNTVTVTVDGQEPQSKTDTTITNGSAVFAIIFVGESGTAFPGTDQISVELSMKQEVE